MRTRLVVAVVAVLAVLAGEASAATPHPFAGKRTITVMTRNLYLGTELGPIFGAGSLPVLFGAVGAGYAGVQASDPGARAAAVAAEIAATRPDVVALQEAALYRVDVPADGPATPAETVTYDFLSLLLAALDVRGLAYEPVGLHVGLDAELPAGLPPALDVRLTDRHVVLLRADRRPSDLKVEAVQTGSFATTLVAPTAAGPLAVPRGWSAVHLKVRGKRFSVVHTHLEAFSPLVQGGQVAELLAGPLDTDRPVIVVGDLNSQASGVGGPAYPALRAAGFADAWLESGTDGPGNTCCHALADPSPLLTHRIDYVLARGGFRVLDAAVVGDDPAGRTPGGLWPSDHAGVVATLTVPR